MYTPRAFQLRWFWQAYESRTKDKAKNWQL